MTTEQIDLQKRVKEIRERAEKRTLTDVATGYCQDIPWLLDQLALEQKRVKELEAENGKLRNPCMGVVVITEEAYAELQQLRERGATFKAFHSSLCRRFGYGHDEIDWMRDLISLEEHIAAELQQLRAELASWKEGRDAVVESAQELRRENKQLRAERALIQDHDKQRLESDSIVASCDCLTKSSNSDHHKPGCKYRILIQRDSFKIQAEVYKQRTEQLERDGKCIEAELKAELQQLRAENVAMRAFVANAGAVTETSEKLFAQLTAERDQLRAERDELRRRAEPQPFIHPCEELCTCGHKHLWHWHHEMTASGDRCHVDDCQCIHFQKAKAADATPGSPAL